MKPINIIASECLYSNLLCNGLKYNINIWPDFLSDFICPCEFTCKIYFLTKKQIISESSLGQVEKNVFIFCCFYLR